MDVKIPPGTYVLAVSGGVDSMVLLDILRRHADLKLIIAHFNHGIRQDSDQDEKLVSKAAKDYGLIFEVGHGRLGPSASEAEARKARHEFLEKVKDKYKADSIITAHHQDDHLETALINILRGTGRLGLTAIASNKHVIRPLLSYPKSKILDYGKKHKIQWRDDPTNKDIRYLRNYIRHNITAKMPEEKRRNLLENIDKVAITNIEINSLIATFSHNIIKNNKLNRSRFALLPHKAQLELLAFWLRNNDLNSFDRRIIERLVIAINTAPVGTRHDVYKGKSLIVGQSSALIES